MHGVNGLIIATFMAGIMLIIMGLARLGSVIKFIPYPLIIGFTSGIALIIFSSEVKDFLGLNMGAVPADFLDKWKSFILHSNSVNPYSVLIGISTILIILFWPKITHKVPGSLIAIFVTTFGDAMVAPSGGNHRQPVWKYFKCPAETGIPTP